MQKAVQTNKIGDKTGEDMKNHRHDVILEIITEYDVETQEQLMELLVRRGINAAQATL